MPYVAGFPVPLGEADLHQAFFDSQLHLRDAPASLPVPNSTHSFWLHPSEEVNPLAKEGSEGPIASDADICIIGSGITGVSAAYHLSKSVPDKKVVILEARDFCSGATGRNGGHLTSGLFWGITRQTEQMGIEEAKKQYALEAYTVENLIQIIKDNNLEDTVDFVPGGHLEILLTQKEVEAAQADAALANEAGIDLSQVTFLSKDEMSETYGTAYPGVRTPGYNLWPLKLITQLFHLAKSGFSASDGSLSLFTSAPVTAVSPLTQGSANADSQRRWTVSTPRGSLSCTSVIHATNAHASHLLPFLAGPKGIVPVRGQVIATRASVPLSTEERASWAANEGFEYWFPRPSKEQGDEERPLVIIGGGREGSTGYGIGITDDSVVDPKAGKLLREFLPAVFPGKYKKETEPDREWTGIMGFTSIGDPFVGPVVTPDGSELKGQYIAAGYHGHGMPRTFAWYAQLVSRDGISHPHVSQLSLITNCAASLVATDCRSQTLIVPDGRLMRHHIPVNLPTIDCSPVLGGHEISAEAVSSLLAHDLAGLPRENWSAPEWLPKRYLTWNRT